MPSPRRRPVGRQRGSEVYAKPGLSYNQLIDRLRSRGLVVPDEDRVIRYLRHIGYYRLSPYMIPFQRGKGDHTFASGTAFDDVLGLYVFDRQLRLHVLDGLERVEVAVRANLTDTMSALGGPHWYVGARYFKNAADHQRLLNEIRGECEGQLSRPAEASGDHLVFPSALEHYLTRYGQPELPPSWVTMEMLSIGQLSHLVSNLRERGDRTTIARSLGINDPLLASWLRTYSRVRNICAHHGRLWNVGLGVYPALPSARNVPWLADRASLAEHPDRARRLYPVLVSIQSILCTVSPHSSWANRLVGLLEDHPQVPLRGMGMFPGWHQDPFWLLAQQA
jgi:abortive infection bacteriophage resistance protein